MVSSVTSPSTPPLPMSLRGQGSAEGSTKTGEPGNGAAKATATPEGKVPSPAVEVHVSSRAGSSDLGTIDVDSLSDSDVDNLIQSTASQLAASGASIAGQRGMADLQALFQ
ncbi:MAG TPA: hypothetical protein VEB64_00565 [Azospirillaceae bacterium]|nr:hypothetical protein [Azospirillaceae bacterium]